MNDKGSLNCSFCGSKQSAVNKLIVGHGAFICNNCIQVCNTIIKDSDVQVSNKQENFTESNFNLTPIEIKKKLDEYVIGQEDVKKILSVAVYNHYKRINFNAFTNDIEITKSNILLIGPTGCGKTLLAQSIAKIINVPFAIADATTLTEAGYVGEDVENVISKLFQNANFDIDKTQKGIIFIDEIDKVGRKSDSPSITRDVSGEGVQQALLKIIEGTVANIPQGAGNFGRKHPQQETISINTKDILFICGGAFEGLEKIISRRIINNNIGFLAEVKTKEEKEKINVLQNILSDDLIKFGLIPELIGRLPIIGTLNQLNIEDLIKILVEPKNAIIKQYKALLKLDNRDITFHEDAIKNVAIYAKEKNLGARGLRSLIEKILLDTMYDTYEKNIEISKDFVLEKLNNKI